MALARGLSCRCLAAAMIGAVSSGCIGCRLRLPGIVCFERCDDLFEVAGDLPVHLGLPGVAAGFGGGDDLQSLPVLLAVLGQELRCRDEHRASQAPLTELTSAFGHVTRLLRGGAASLPA